MVHWVCIKSHRRQYNCPVLLLLFVLTFVDSVSLSRVKNHKKMYEQMISLYTLFKQMRATRCARIYMCSSMVACEGMIFMRSRKRPGDQFSVLSEPGIPQDKRTGERQPHRLQAWTGVMRGRCSWTVTQPPTSPVPQTHTQTDTCSSILFYSLAKSNFASVASPTLYSQIACQKDKIEKLNSAADKHDYMLFAPGPGN